MRFTYLKYKPGFSWSLQVNNPRRVASHSSSASSWILNPDAALHFERNFLLFLLFSAILDKNRKYFFTQLIRLKTMLIIRQNMQHLRAHLINFSNQLCLLRNWQLILKNLFYFVSSKRDCYCYFSNLCVKQYYLKFPLSKFQYLRNKFPKKI